MTQHPKHLEVTRAIDLQLSNDRFNAVTRTSANKYQPWYAMLLSTMALLAAEEKVIFAHSDYEPTMAKVRIVVFTTNLVLVADIDPNVDGVPVANVARRRSLVGLRLSASERIDAYESRSYEWPGTLNLVLTYRDFMDSIEIVADGASPYAIDHPTPIVTLIEGLSADLANSRAIG